MIANIETNLSFLGCPLSIRIPIINQFIAACISYFDRGVAQCSLSAPLDLVACGFGNQEGRAASLVAITIDTFLDSEVQDFSLRYGGCCSI